MSGTYLCNRPACRFFADELEERYSHLTEGDPCPEPGCNGTIEYDPDFETDFDLEAYEDEEDD